jgi:FkbM family methyltransferase
METIFDIGMYDASDTRYYLKEGFKVVAVEANPILVRSAENSLHQFIDSSQLILINAAIVEDTSKPIELTICGDDLGASSIYKEKIIKRNPIGSYHVPGISLHDLFQKFGIPFYLKVDIEGADRFCVLGLTINTRPRYLSFEVGNDFEELLNFSESIGYTYFKLINQCNFRELCNQRLIIDRIANRMNFLFNYNRYELIKRRGRFFKSMFSSGPVPWYSDGKWQSARSLFSRWQEANIKKNIQEWYDLHAM